MEVKCGGCGNNYKGSNCDKTGREPGCTGRVTDFTGEVYTPDRKGATPEYKSYAKNQNDYNMAKAKAYRNNHPYITSGKFGQKVVPSYLPIDDPRTIQGEYNSKVLVVTQHDVDRWNYNVDCYRYSGVYLKLDGYSQFLANLQVGDLLQSIWNEETEKFDTYVNGIRYTREVDYPDIPLEQF